MSNTWTVTCDATTYMNFTPVDNRADSRVSLAVGTFGLGNVNSTGKIGYFKADVSNATVDGVTSLLFLTQAATFTPAASVPMSAGLKTGWASGANTQQSGKVFVADIKVTPYLGNSTDMNGPITENTDIDGSVTLTFAYGI